MCKFSETCLRIVENSKLTLNFATPKKNFKNRYFF